MLIRRVSKTVSVNKNGSGTMNVPKEAIDKCGRNYIMDIHDDKIVMIPIKSLENLNEK